MSHVHIVAEEVAKLKRLMTDNTEIKELRAQIDSLSSLVTYVKGKTLKITPEVSGRVDIVVDEVAELRAQIDSLSSSVKGKTLKITPDVLGLPVKPVCGNCSNNAGGPPARACYMVISWSTVYNPTLTRSMNSDASGTCREDGNGPYGETQTPISITLSPGDKVIVQSASFICNKQFIRKNCPVANLQCGKYYNDVKNFVQEAFDKLCSEVPQPLEPYSSVNKQNNQDDSKIAQLRGQIDNMNDFLGKQRVWIMEKFRACSTGALNHSTVETHLKDYPGLRMAVSTFSTIINPQKREFKIINKETKNYLYSEGDPVVALNPSTYSHMPQGHSIWTLEPV